VQSPAIEVENGTDKTILQRSSGGTASVNFILPNDYGTNGQVLSDNGSGSLSWEDQQITSLTTTFSSSDVISGSKFIGNCPVNKIVSDADIIINSEFDNNTTITIGDASAQARLMGIADNFPDSLSTYETEPNYQYLLLTGLYLYFSGTPTQGDGKAIIHLS